MGHFPPPSRPPSFRLRHVVRLRIVPNRWPYSLGAAFCVAAPVAFGWSVGDVPAGLVASIGAFTALYGAGRPYNNRALVLAAIANGLACAVGLGAWSQPFGRLGIATVVLVATCATFFCNALRIEPPGAYMFALAGAIGTSLPTQHLDWWHAALLVLAGGGCHRSRARYAEQHSGNVAMTIHPTISRSPQHASSRLRLTSSALNRARFSK